MKRRTTFVRARRSPRTERLLAELANQWNCTREEALERILPRERVIFLKHKASVTK